MRDHRIQAESPSPFPCPSMRMAINCGRGLSRERTHVDEQLDRLGQPARPKRRVLDTAAGPRRDERSVLGEVLDRKRVHDRLWVPPAVTVEAGLATGVLEKRLAIPAVVLGDLGQQQTTRHASLDHQTVHSDGDLRRIKKWLQLRHHRDLDLYLIQLFPPQRAESRIAKGRCNGVGADAHPQRFDRLDVSDASPEHAVDGQGDKGTPALGEYVVHGLETWPRPVLEPRRDRIAGEVEQRSSLAGIKTLVHVPASLPAQDGIVTR